MNQEIRFCSAVDGVRLAYAKSGQGLPVVKVGTWLTHLEYDWDSPVWGPWLNNWSRFHTLFRYDPRGCGLSDWNVDNISLEALVSDLETVVDAAGIKQFGLVGMSQGGCIAVMYAARHPERITRLIVYGGYLMASGRKNLTPIEHEEKEVFKRLLRLAWAVDNPAYKQVLSTELLPDGTAEQIRWLNNLQRISTSAENALKLYEIYEQVNVKELALTVRTPTLVLHAKHDVAVPFAEGRLFATHLSNSRLVPLDSKNHILLPSERAWKQFWHEYYTFLGIKERINETTAEHHTLTDAMAYIALLTHREREILQLIVQGYRNEEIAEKLVLAPKTIRNYVSHIYEKLQVSSRGEVIALAHQAGLGNRQ